MQRLKNTKGQVAIFVALIFQVLFLFFAMVLNVGLLIHHKINLQNSVDLAAYYGAMKQAESMNAIAHLNYQIRQSWKLLAWRYRVLGLAGNREWPTEADSSHLPYIYDPVTGGTITSSASDDPTFFNGLNNQIKSMFEQPTFCIGYSPVKPVNVGENMCKFGVQNRSINIFGVPPVVAGFIGMSTALRQSAIFAQIAINNACKLQSPLNWIALARFKIAYLQDIGERKKALNAIANSLSGSTTGADPTKDFLDLDGDSAAAGIKNTLLKNLTAPNRDTASVEVYNALGSDNCRMSTGNYLNIPPKWLNEVLILPGLGVLLSECNATGNNGGIINRFAFQLENIIGVKPQGAPYDGEHMLYLNEPFNSSVKSEYDELKNYVNPPVTGDNPYRPSLGFEKNPWCMAYVGVKATAKPKIPFSPLGDITLKAYSYAKPFGGRIGPWFYNQWSSGSNRSSDTGAAGQTDPTAPKRVDDASQVTGSNATQYIYTPNYARFPGDSIGLKSPGVMAYYWKAFQTMSQFFSNSNGMPAKVTNLFSQMSNLSPSIDEWTMVSHNFSNDNTSRDILSWDKTQNLPTQMRLLEISAVAPDLFDTTYYSIDPNFYQAYYPKIKKFLSKVPNGSNINLPLDFGSRLGDSTYEKFNIKNQIQTQNQISSFVDPNSILNYQIRNSADHLLTGWVPNNLLEYDFAPTKFGKCDNSAQKPQANYEIPGDCINMGRVGFSVKLVSGDYLRRSDLTLGGASAGSGSIVNPPPSDW